MYSKDAPTSLVSNDFPRFFNCDFSTLNTRRFQRKGKTLYFSNMKRVFLTFALICASFAGWAQSAQITATSLDLHITQETSQDDLKQMQQTLAAAGIGFRYDLVSWEESTLQSIRMAVILSDGTLQTHEIETFEADTDLRILLEGGGEDRIFCVGIDCPE